MTLTKVCSLNLPWIVIVVALGLTISLSMDFLYPPKLVLFHQLLVRGIALITLLALHSLSLQIRGLIGKNGLIPLSSTLYTLEKNLKSIEEEDKERSDDEDNAAKDNKSKGKSEVNRDSFVVTKLVQTVSKMLSPKGIFHILLRLVLEKVKPSKPNQIHEHLTMIINLDMFIAFITILLPYPLFFLYLCFTYYAYKHILSPFLTFPWDRLLLESLVLTFFTSSITYTSSYLVIISIWLYKILLFRILCDCMMMSAYVLGFFTLLCLFHDDVVWIVGQYICSYDPTIATSPYSMTCTTVLQTLQDLLYKHTYAQQ